MSKNDNYADIAFRYNIARPLNRKDTEYWMTFISKKIGHRKNIKLLDLGCGNGRFAILFAQKLGYKIIGTDNSPAMLEQAKQNDNGGIITWDLQDATHLDYLDNSFDAVWISHLLHLVDDPQSVVNECYRVLKSQGILINRYASLEDNLQKPERKFFPELAQLDTARIPRQKDVEKWFYNAGFLKINIEHLVVPTFKTGKERYYRACQRAESGLVKISDKNFKQGLMIFKKYIEKHRNNPWILNEVYTIITAVKDA